MKNNDPILPPNPYSPPDMILLVTPEEAIQIRLAAASEAKLQRTIAMLLGMRVARRLIGRKLHTDVQLSVVDEAPPRGSERLFNVDTSLWDGSNG